MSQDGINFRRAHGDFLHGLKKKLHHFENNAAETKAPMDSDANGTANATVATPSGHHYTTLLKARRKPVKRSTLKARVRQLLKTQKAKEVAKNYVLSLRRVCEEVRRKKGAASGS